MNDPALFFRKPREVTAFSWSFAILFVLLIGLSALLWPSKWSRCQPWHPGCGTRDPPPPPPPALDIEPCPPLPETPDAAAMMVHHCCTGSVTSCQSLQRLAVGLPDNAAPAPELAPCPEDPQCAGGRGCEAAKAAAGCCRSHVPDCTTLVRMWAARLPARRAEVTP